MKRGMDVTGPIAPARQVAEMEAQILALRDAHPRRGGRKVRHRLVALGAPNVPAASTITAILPPLRARDS